MAGQTQLSHANRAFGLFLHSLKLVITQVRVSLRSAEPGQEELRPLVLQQDDNGLGQEREREDETGLQVPLAAHELVREAEQVEQEGEPGQGDRDDDVWLDRVFEAVSRGLVDHGQVVVAEQDDVDLELPHQDESWDEAQDENEPKAFEDREADFEQNQTVLRVARVLGFPDSHHEPAVND